MSDISKHLDEAEKHLAIAVSMMLKDAGSAKRMPSGSMWFGSWGDVSKATKAMLRVRALAQRFRFMETPRKRKPGAFAAQPGRGGARLADAGIYHEIEPACSACFARGCNGECMENL